MNKSITISVSGLILFAIAIFIGYLIGKSSAKPSEQKTKTITTTSWVKGDIVRDTIKVPSPYKVEVSIPDSISVPSKTDTTKLFATWKDYYLKRRYNLDFSNDTLGTFKVDAVVSQNKLVSTSSFIQTNIRTVHEKEVIYRVPTLQFYGIVGTSVDFKTNKMQFGVDLKQKFMLGVSGIRIEDKYGYTIDAGIKF